MRGLIEKASTNSGEYWGRRARDSKIMKMSKSDALSVIKRKAAKTSKDAPSDWLLVWWVPPEYVSAGESKWRIERGYIKPLWDWGKGASGLKLDFDSVVQS